MTFTLFISPKAQKRARSRAITTKIGKTIATTYKDAGQRLRENQLITLLYQHKPPEPLQGPLFLQVDAYLPIPKSKPKKWLTEALAGIIRPTTKPDCDNLAKQIKDCMNGVFYQDDRQIVSLFVRKFYGDVPRWEINLSKAEYV